MPHCQRDATVREAREPMIPGRAVSALNEIYQKAFPGIRLGT